MEWARAWWPLRRHRVPRRPGGRSTGSSRPSGSARVAALFSIMDGDDEHRVDAAFSPVPRPGARNDAHCGAVGGGSVHQVIVVTAALKGGVGKTTTSIYLAALATANRNVVTLVDADPQASAAEWVDAANAQEERFDAVNIVEAPTERLLVKTLDRLAPGSTAAADPRPTRHSR